MTAHSRRRKVTKRLKAKQGPLQDFTFETFMGKVIVAAHSATEAVAIFKKKHGYEANPKEKTDD